MTNYRIIDRCDNFYDVVNAGGYTENPVKLSCRKAAEAFMARLVEADERFEIERSASFNHNADQY